MDLLKPQNCISRDADYKQMIQTAIFTLEYERSCKLVEIIVKDEEIRKLQARTLLLEDDLDEVNDQLADEEARAEDLVARLDEAVGSIEVFENENQRLELDLRAKIRELENAKAELSALQTISNDSTKILTEKLSLARELSVLRPELASLRAEAASNRELLSEKLALQRQLATVQVELENAQRTAKRALAKAGGSHDQSEYDAQIDELEMKLREAKLARKDAERELEQMRHELETETCAAKRSKGKAAKSDENVSELQDIVDDLKRQLTAEKKKNSKEKTSDHTSAQSSTLKAQVDKLRSELTEEKREREKAEKALQKEQASWEAQKSLLDDKLAQFRTKLRSTKEKLKEAEDQLEKARMAAAQSSSQAVAEEPVKKSRKRAVSKMDPDALLGTPGPEPAAKRGKKDASIRSSAPGDKSTFSITPFLNRTVTLTETPEAGAPAEVEDALEENTAEDIETPSNLRAKKQSGEAAKKQLIPKSSKPLSQVSSSKHNAKSKSKQAERRKTAKAPELEKVIEENTELDNNPTQTGIISANEPQFTRQEATATLTFPSTQAFTETQNFNVTSDLTKSSEESNQATTATATSKSLLKPRKSLLAFPSFTSTSDAPEKKIKTSKSAVVTKRRKLLGSSSIGSSFLADSGADGPTKTVTLFDEEDEADRMMPVKPIPGRGLFAKRALGKTLGVKGQVSAGASMVTDNGFQFSPLKKDRRGGNVSVMA